jgi:uncharacterized protein
MLANAEEPFRNPTDVVSHRPWPLPRLPWIQRMRWNRLLFLHWPVDTSALRALMPCGLDVDLFEETAWVSITPFVMSRVALRGMPDPLGFEFLELNVRTYVTVGGRPGIWFFSLDASSAIAVVASRVAYRLPYYRASMAIAHADSSIDFRATRRSGHLALAQLHVKYESAPGAAPAVPGSLEAFLVERYCLYAVDSHQRMYRGEIHHRPWLLQDAAAEIHTNSYAAINGIQLPPSLPLCHYSELLDVVAYPLQRI